MTNKESKIKRIMKSYCLEGKSFPMFWEDVKEVLKKGLDKNSSPLEIALLDLEIFYGRKFYCDDNSNSFRNVLLYLFGQEKKKLKEDD